jgi:hypothetical protein
MGQVFAWNNVIPLTKSWLTAGCEIPCTKLATDFKDTRHCDAGLSTTYVSVQSFNRLAEASSQTVVSWRIRGNCFHSTLGLG